MKKTVRIQTDETIGIPHPRMWGIFYEEINHAGDGGLYAELIRNRSFADSNLPEGTFYADGHVRTVCGHTEPFDISDPLPGWTAVTEPDAWTRLEKIVSRPRNVQCPEQMRVTVQGTHGRVVNTGYWGICGKAQAYYGYLIVRSASYTELTVGLMHKDGTVMASAVCADMGPSYTTCHFRFTVPAAEADDDARFFIDLPGEGTADFDFVTLFPEDTYASRPFGFRRDIVEMLRDLKPGFLRFPGGCVVEGINLDNAIHWKQTVGPIEDRPGHWDLWGYRCTDGIGMLEFCQLAEDLDADIMYVANCGMSCQFRSSELADEAGVDFWLKNALDAVEYIAGPATSPWGAKRAADGHPAPFRLRYIEIGNENHGPDYEERYRRFYAALHERYPDCTLLADGPVPDAPVDMVDDHYYTPPQTFPTMNERYCAPGGLVYVGEYACNTDVGYGNLLSAVSEATFMTHLENACSRVRLASYAPLLCNENDRTWPVNLINFDRKHVFGIPSYYVQRLFARNPVERVVHNDNTVEKGALTNTYVTTGIDGGDLVIKIAVFGPEPVAVDFLCPAVRDGACRLWTVASASEKDTNSLLYPKNVAQTLSAVTAADGMVSCQLHPWSFTLLRCPLT